MIFVVDIFYVFFEVETKFLSELYRTVSFFQGWTQMNFSIIGIYLAYLHMFILSFIYEVHITQKSIFFQTCFFHFYRNSWMISHNEHRKIIMHLSMIYHINYKSFVISTDCYIFKMITISVLWQYVIICTVKSRLTVHYFHLVIPELWLKY